MVRSFFRLTLVCLLALAACRGLDRRRGQGGDATTTTTATNANAAPPPPLIASEDSPDLDVPLTLRPLEGTAVSACRDRAALMITADRYRARPTDDLPQLARGVAALREALATACSIPGASIVEKAGAAAIPQEIESAIIGFGETMSGTPALLTVFYSGHGVIDAQGQLQLFTHYTDREGSTFTYTLPRSELLRWLGTARARAKGRGVELQTVLIVDACRTATLSAPPRAKLVREETWELYSTSEGELADAPRDAATPFVAALCGSLDDLAGRGESDLRTTFTEVKRRLAEANAAQTPQLVAPNDGPGPRLVLPGRVRIGLRVVDALDGVPMPVPAGSVQADGKALPQEGDFFILMTNAGRNVQLQATVAGYRPFARSLAIERTQNGSAFALPLPPEFTRVRGTVSPSVAIEVIAQCDDAQAVPRDRYHRMEAYTAVNNPNFELRLPPAAPTARTRLVFKQFDRELLVRPIDLAASQPDPRLEGVRVLDLGTVELPGADVSALPVGPDLATVREIAAAAFAQDRLGGVQPPPQFARPNLVAPTFTDRFQTITWEEALRAFQDGNLPKARTHLRSLEQTLRAQPVDAVTDLMGHIELRLAADAKSDDEVVSQIASAPPESALATGLRAILAARKLRRASELAANGDLGAVAPLLEAAMQEPDTDTPYATEARKRLRDLRWSIAATLYDKAGAARWRAIAEQLRADNPEAWNDPDWSRLEQPVSVAPLAEFLSEGLERGMNEGDWTVADDALDQRRRIFPNNDQPQQLVDLEIQIAQERVPLSVRQSYKDAEKAETAGNLEEALRLFGQARTGANTHWMGKIEKRERLLREQVFRTQIQRASAAGDVATELDALLGAATITGRSIPRLTEILRDNPALASKPEVQGKLAAIDAAQLAAARASRSRQVWQQYLEDNPAGAGAAEARAMMERMAKPWQQVGTAGTSADLVRYGHALAYDEARGVTLMFGGTSDGRSVRDDTWSWDGQTWQVVSTPTRPPARAFHAMVYDATRRTLVLFGGSADGDTGKVLLGDTWLFDGNTWRAVESTPQPPARCKHAMAFDAERNRVVLYGGDNRKDTWEWDGERWLDVSPPKVSPKELIGAGMAYSRPEHRVVMFGGNGRRSSAWFWDGRAWLSQSKPGVEGTDGGTLVATGNRLLLFGGFGRTVSDNLLTYDNGAWSASRVGAPPAPRQFHAAAFDSKRNMLIVHGGMAPPARRRDPAQVFGDTWEFVVEP